MLRRPSLDTKINHERWLVSYADFITLLFAFFVVMYSVSQVNETKYKTLSETLETAFNSSSSKQSKQNSENQSAAEPSLAPLKQLESELEKALEGVLQTGDVKLNGNQEWVEIAIDANSFFPSGRAAPTTEARALLRKVADVLAPFDNAVAIGGHTDDIPISNAEFKNNWELSAGRAVSVVNLLAFSGVDPKRLSAVGYGEYRPVASNETEEGRTANRRVVLRVERGAADIPKVDSTEGLELQRTRGESGPTAGADSLDSSSEQDSNGSNQEPRPLETVEPVKLRNGGLLFTSDPDQATPNR